MRRLRNQERGSQKDAQGAWDLDFYRRICDTREPTMHEVLQYLESQQSQEGMSFNSNLDSTRVAQLEVVHGAKRDRDTESMLRRDGSKDGEKLFRQQLQARGLSSNAVDRVISNWSNQWRRHIAGLTLLAGYLKRIHQQPDYLLDLDQPQIFMANYLEDIISQKCSDNSVKNQRCALAVLLKFMGYSEQQIHSDLVKQLMRKIRMRLRQIDKEKQIWDLDILLNYIKQQVPLLEQGLLSVQQRRAIAATLVMVFTVARLAELHRATLLSTLDDEYIIQTTILKSPQRIAEFKICKIPDERICPLRWFKSWFAVREPDIPNKAQELWRISQTERNIQADDLSKAIRAVMQSAGISK
ncbi:MAG: hypothetical protein EZS28_045460, partial [Streblomastix strix]